MTTNSNTNFFDAGGTYAGTSSEPTSPWYSNDYSGWDNSWDNSFKMKSDDSWLSSLWDWAQTEQGSGAIVGLIGGAVQANSANDARKDARDATQQQMDQQMQVHNDLLAQRQAEFAAKERTLREHNDSINKAPAPVKKAIFGGR